MRNTTPMIVQFRTSNGDIKDAKKQVTKPFHVFKYTWNILDTWGEFNGSETIFNDLYSMTLTY